MLFCGQIPGSMIQFIRDMENTLQIVGLGLATLDVLVRMTRMPTWSRERDRDIQGFRFEGGGLVATAMVAAAKLGAQVGFVGTAGSDEAAELKLRSMVACGVDLRRLVRRPGQDDQVVLVYVHAETGERVFSTMERMPLRPLQVEELDRDYIISAEYLHVDGFHAEAALQAARWMKAAGKTVVMDGNKTSAPIGAHLRALVPYVDVLITGEGFAAKLTGIEDIWEAGAAVLKIGPRVFVETVGDRGSYTVTAHERFHTPAFQVDVVDTTGAGDVFHGAYIVGLLQGWNLRQIALFSSAVAAIKCTQLGGRSGIPSFEETLAFLHRRGVRLDDMAGISSLRRAG
jgi:sulfofructose kinase